jgi:hypothetical protein
LLFGRGERKCLPSRNKDFVDNEFRLVCFYNLAGLP